jgi:hypothetical protein
VSQEKRVTYLRKSHPVTVEFEIKGGGWIQKMSQLRIAVIQWNIAAQR